MRIAIDLCMAALLLALMASALIAPATHEWAGVALLILGLIHALINYRRLRGAARGAFGRRMPQHIIIFAVGIALVLCTVGMIASSLVLSQHAFGWLPAIPGASWARMVHMMGSHWMFILAAVHTGLHVRAITRLVAQRRLSRRRVGILAVLLVGIGIIACAATGYLGYLTGATPFFIVPVDEPVVLTSAGRYLVIGIAFCAAAACLPALVSTPPNTPEHTDRP